MLRKPFDKFIRSIKEFRTPQKLANVWSWFGLINRVSHYVYPILATFKPLVNLKNQFIWNKELVLSFCIFKEIIVDAVKKGVEIFDSNWLTCPQPDWSRIDIGFFLSQKNCEWTQRSLGCCENEWKITLAGFQSLRSIETRYAPIKEEALANAWSLEQTQCFTHGCDILQIITDYKTITKLFGNQTLDNITNPILLRVQQQTLLWRFFTQHVPDEDNHFSDAMSLHPRESPKGFSYWERSFKSSLCTHIDNVDTMEIEIATTASQDLHIITWDLVQIEIAKDGQTQALITRITCVIPLLRDSLPSDIQDFWKCYNDLCISSGFVLFKYQIVVPRSIWQEVFQSLHSAHQGVTTMSKRLRLKFIGPGL